METPLNVETQRLEKEIGMIGTENMILFRFIVLAVVCIISR